MAALMEALGHDSFSIAGWSDGANAAVLAAIGYPARVNKLVIWGGNPEVTAEDIALYEKLRSISAWSARMRASLSAIYGDTLEALWTAWCDSMNAIYDTGGDICRTRLAQVRCPCLILHGAKDPLLPAFHPQTFNKGIRGSRLHVFVEGRHNLHLVHAQEFNRVAREFLEGHAVE